MGGKVNGGQFRRKNSGPNLCTISDIFLKKVRRIVESFNQYSLWAGLNWIRTSRTATPGCLHCDSVSFIRLLVCLTTGPKPLPKPALHIVRSRASSFRWEYLFLFLRSSSSFLRLLPRLPVTSIPLFIFRSITCCRRQFLRKMWPIKLAFRLLISCRIFLYSLTLSNTSSFLTWSVQLIFSTLLQHHISKPSRCFCCSARSVQVSAPRKAMLQM